MKVLQRTLNCILSMASRGATKFLLPKKYVWEWSSTLLFYDFCKQFPDICSQLLNSGDIYE